MSDYGSTPPPPPPPGGGDGGYGAPPPGGGDGGYGAPQHGGAGGPVDHPKGITILVLGILSLVCCAPLGVAAFVMGNNALKEIDADPARYGNRQIIVIGRILGIIGMVFLVLGLLYFLFVVALGVFSA